MDCSVPGFHVHHQRLELAQTQVHRVSDAILLHPHVLGNRLTQKDDADSGVQFITPAGPRKSLLIAKDPDQVL